jgi:hypothetical protein
VPFSPSPVPSPAPGDNWARHANATAYANELISAKVKRLASGVEVIDMMRCLQGTESDSPSIITRKPTRELWDKALDSATSAAHPFMKDVLVTGSPGVGKSRSMAYLLRKLLLNGKTVVYEAAKEGLFFLFKATGGDGNDEEEGGGSRKSKSKIPRYEVMSLSSMNYRVIEELNDCDNFYLIDPDEGSAKDPLLVKAHTILVSSPKIARYKGFALKRPRQTTILYMPMWKIEELEAVRHILDRTATKDELIGWFHDLGGRPRSIFGGDTYRTNEVTSIRDRVKEMTLDALMSIIDCGADLKESADDKRLGSDIWGYKSTTPFDPICRELGPISELVVREIAKKFARVYWSQYDSLPSSFATFKGLVFQDIALMTIALGDQKTGLKCTHWKYKVGGTYEKINFTKMFTKKDLRTVPSLRGKGNLKEEGVINQSFDTTEPLIDGSSTEGTFQMTIAEKHPLSWKGSMSVTEAWGATKYNPMPFYICVPDDMYGKWKNRSKPPPFKSPSADKTETFEMMAKMDFFVLSIPMGKNSIIQLMQTIK